MVGAANADVAGVRPLRDQVGRPVSHLGGAGSGQAMTCTNHLVSAVASSATAEGLAIGKRDGLDPAVMGEPSGTAITAGAAPRLGAG